MKRCRECGTDKPLDQFEHGRRKCKKCKKAAESKWKEANANRYRDSLRRWRRENPDRCKELRVKWVKENQELYKKAASNGFRKWAAKNKEHLSERFRQWAKDNPEKTTARNNNYRSRKLGASGSFTASQILQLFGDQCGLCAACRSVIERTGKRKYHIDHITALINGGSNDISNLQLLCSFCNHSKKDREYEKWLEWMRSTGRIN